MGVFNLIQRLKIKYQNDSEGRIKLLRKAGVHIGEGCEIYDGINWGSEPYLISVGNYVRITKGVNFITHDGGVWVLRNLKKRDDIDLIRPIKIGNNVHIGMNATIMPGVIIGDNCIIGCNAVVTKNRPAGQIWGGVPAKYIKTVEEYYLQHETEFEYTKKFSTIEKRKYLERKYNKDIFE